MHVHFLGITTIYILPAVVWMIVEKITCICSFERTIKLRFSFACGTTFPFLIIKENSTTNLLFSGVILVQNKIYRKRVARKFLIGLLGTRRSNILIEKQYC